MPTKHFGLIFVSILSQCEIPKTTKQKVNALKKVIQKESKTKRTKLLASLMIDTPLAI
jgi:hypothetical protein